MLDENISELANSSQDENDEESQVILSDSNVEDEEKQSSGKSKQDEFEDEEDGSDSPGHKSTDLLAGGRPGRKRGNEDDVESSSGILRKRPADFDKYIKVRLLHNRIGLGRGTRQGNLDR